MSNQMTSEGKDETEDFSIKEQEFQVVIMIQYRTTTKKTW